MPTLSELVTILIALGQVLPQIWDLVQVIYDAAVKIVELTGRAIPGISLPSVGSTFSALSAEDEADIARLKSALAAHGVQALAWDGSRLKAILEFVRANPWLLQLLIGSPKGA